MVRKLQLKFQSGERGGRLTAAIPRYLMNGTFISVWGLKSFGKTLKKQRHQLPKVSDDIRSQGSTQGNSVYNSTATSYKQLPGSYLHARKLKLELSFPVIVEQSCMKIWYYMLCTQIPLEMDEDKLQRALIERDCKVVRPLFILIL